MTRTTNEPLATVEDAPSPSGPSPVPLCDQPTGPAEALIEEARRRHRRRRTFSLLALLAAIGLAAGLTDVFVGSRPPARAHHGPTIASPGEISAFLTRAEKGAARQFLLRYRVQYGAGPSAVDGSVVVAQLSRTRWSYTSTPSIHDIPARGSTSSVFTNPPGQLPGWYLCNRQAASSPWNCADMSKALMGSRAALLGPYPPIDLVLGLQNAISGYEGRTSTERKYVGPEPARLLDRGVGARTSSCLAFGNPARPVALVCLDATGVITSYDVPEASSDSAYTKAELRYLSRHVPAANLVLPAKPAPTS